jgi:tRNA U55 pseudouridine synthase TruB
MQILARDESSLRVEINCSRGTYARVLADEIASALGSAGHLAALSRTRSGPFVLKDALGIEKLGEIVDLEPGHPWQDVLMSRGPREARLKWKPREAVFEALSPWVRSAVACLPNLPLVDTIPVQARRIRSGGNLPAAPGGVQLGGRYLVVCADDVVAVGEHTSAGPKALCVLE